MNFKDRLFLRKYSFLQSGISRFYRDLLASQFLSPEELKTLQWQKTRSILTYAYEHIPFYRSRFQKIGLHPGDIRCPDQYDQVPLLRRHDLRNHFNDLCLKNPGKSRVKLSSTGGTTGVPVKVLLDRKDNHAALGWRLQQWWNMGPATSMGLVWRNTPGSVIDHAKEFARNWPAFHVRLNASSLSDNSVRQFFDLCRKKNIRVLHGYTGAIHYLADFVVKNRLHCDHFDLIWVTCSPLSEVHRNLIARAFNAPVLDQYGSCEVYWLAAQCPESPKMHIFADSRNVEFTDENGIPVPHGTEGQIIITDLENRVFPIIRYAIGDRGRRCVSSCTCGVNLPLMDPVKGKTVDIIYLPDGTGISDMNVIFDDYPEAVKSFQIHQRKDYSLEIRYVPDESHPGVADILARVRKKLITQTRSQIPLNFRPVNSIPVSKGKLKYIISEINKEEQSPAREPG